MNKYLVKVWKEDGAPKERYTMFSDGEIPDGTYSDENIALAFTKVEALLIPGR